MLDSMLKASPRAARRAHPSTAPLPSESALLNVLMPTCTPPSPALAGNQMASSSNAPLSELEQLKQLQQSGIISVTEFLRMANQIGKTNDGHLAEARGKDTPNTGDGSAGRSSRSESSMMVDEEGNLLEQLSEPAAALFDDEPDENKLDEAAAPTSPEAEPLPRKEPAPTRMFKAGDIVHHPTHGTATFVRLGNTCDFVHNGKARISMQVIKAGCKHKKETKCAWVEPTELMHALPPEERSPPMEHPSPRQSPR